MRINPGLRVVHRNQHTIQIGIGRSGLILEDLSAGDVAVIDRLRRGLFAEELTSAAAAAGISEERAQHLLSGLAPALLEKDVGPGLDDAAPGLSGELLAGDAAQVAASQGRHPAEALRRRSAAVVQLVGLGRTGALLAGSLAMAGVGTFLLADSRRVSAADVGPGGYGVADVGMTRAAAVRRQLLAAGPAVQVHVLPPGLANGPGLRAVDLAIAVGFDAPDPAVCARLLTGDQAHLLVLLREQDGTVGPLVVPGETACAECVQWHHADADPGWPEVRRQLTEQEQHAPMRPEDSSLAVSLAGLAARHALVFLDGLHRPSSWSAVLTLRCADGAWSRREYHPHPGCGCQFQGMGGPG
ncbi:MAG: hypothetical protein JWO93_2417 [Micrococcaceae bacterium]|jgi:bacteriocin biosynthesis cyclodehydratase domain-containing protein|nr:hypothetical protein [Micrococcaceae bacterium]